MLTPAMAHTGIADDVLDARHAIVTAAYAAKTESFIAGAPKRAHLPSAV